MMTRKHFQLIADVLADSEITMSDRIVLADNFADRLAQTNPNFDRQWFLRACLLGLPTGAIEQ